MIKIKNRLKI